jgi:hypothetical protein
MYIEVIALSVDCETYVELEGASLVPYVRRGKKASGSLAVCPSNQGIVLVVCLLTLGASRFTLAAKWLQHRRGLGFVASSEM